MYEAVGSRAVINYAPLSSSTEELAALSGGTPALLAWYDDSGPVRGALLKTRLPHSNERLPDLAAPAVLAAWFEDSAAARGATLQARRPHSSERLSALAAAPVTYGTPWNSSYPRALIATAPRLENIDDLPALPLLAAGAWLDSSAQLYSWGSTVVPQDDVVLSALATAATSHAWSTSRYTAPTWRTRRSASTTDDVADLRGLPPPVLYFEMAEPPVRGKVPHSALLDFARVHDDALPGIGFSSYFVPLPDVGSVAYSRVARFMTTRMQRVAKFPRRP